MHTNKHILYIDIYHYDTSDQREKPVYKSHIAHLSVQYKKYHTLKCADILLKHSTNSSKCFGIRNESIIKTHDSESRGREEAAVRDE